jgi:hypothetical protein
MEEQKKGPFDWLFAGTPFLLTVAVSLLISGTMFYFLVPQPPRVIYSFDAEKFRKDLTARAAVEGASVAVVSNITSELRLLLDEYAARGQTIVVNRRAFLANGLSSIRIVDITGELEKRLFSKYFSSGNLNKRLKEKLFIQGERKVGGNAENF